MNDDSTPSDPSRTDQPSLPPSSAPPATTAPGPTITELIAREDAAVAADSTTPRQHVLTKSQKRAQAQTKKKLEFITQLTNNLDMIIYVELCILYYMDNSFFRLLLRAINQMIFLTPKPQFIPPSPQHRPYIGSIFIPNIICILLHLFCARPEAGEAMRGYLHGGIIIDLIGQKGPSSKFQLIGLDLLVLGLQCFMLAVHVEKERLGSVLKAFTMPTPSTGAETTVAESQTLDAEERGVIRETTTSSEVEEGIELQPLRTPPAQAESSTTAVLSPEHERLLSEPAPHSSEEEETEIEAVEIFWSGTAILADFHILENLRRQWRDYGNATESALQTMGFSAEFAAVTANRRINAASARFQRSVDG